MKESMRLYIRFLFAACCILPWGTLRAATVEPGLWKVLEGCRLVDSNLNDGDSFMVEQSGVEYVFRLYYVDAPETFDTYMDRIRDQARYFSIPQADVLATGKSAKGFTRKFLKGQFTVITKWTDARGGKTPRYFAMVKKNESYLSAELIRNGYARIYGMPTKDRWPGGFTAGSYLGILKSREREAQREQRGIWAIASGSAQVAGLSQLNTDIVNGATATSAPLRSQISASSSRTGKLNLNAATVAELEALPRIGPALARSIIAARPIESIDALVKIPGISISMVDAFRASVILAEPPPPAKTAIFYLADAEAYLNKDVTVIVASVGQSDVAAPESFRTVTLETANEGEYGGSILAVIPDEFYDSFIQFYREPGRKFTGLFYQQDGEFVLVYRRK